MNPRIVPYLLCAVLLGGCVTQTPLQKSIKSEIVCPCDCHLTLERCEVEDPTCKSRKAIEERITTLLNEGYTHEEITAHFREPEFPSVEKLQKEIKTEFESGKPFILYFYNETCSTCIKVKPKIEEIEQKFPSVRLFKIEKRFHDAIFSEYDVETYPLLIVVVNGNEYRNLFSEHDDILSFVQKLLAILGDSQDQGNR